jgi:phage FluMu gp28-like protein
MNARKETGTPTDQYVLLGYQQRWAADRSQVKVMEKSRRIGLSWGEAADDTLYAAEAAGDDVWYIGYNKDMAEEFINDCAFWARHYNLAAGAVEESVLRDEDDDILTFRITFASDNRIVALASTPSNLRGKQGRVVIDEAAFHANLKELIKAAMALTMWGGSVRIISTHDGEANYFNEIIKQIRAGRLPYSLHRVTLDDALAEGLFKRICLVRGMDWSAEAEAKWRQDLIDTYGDGADEELFCIPSQGSGTYLTRLLVEQCMDDARPVLRLSLPDEFKYRPEPERISETAAWCEDHLAPLLAAMAPERRSYFGQDFGRTGDLSVIIPLQETQGARFAAPFAIELRNVPFKQQEQILFYVIDRLPRFTFGALDARGNGQYLAEVSAQHYGSGRIAEVMLSEPWYREQMPKYKAAFEDRSILLPLDADIIEDHRAFKVIRGVARLPESKNTGSDRQKRHGDSGIAGALAWYAANHEEIVEYAYHPVRRRELKDGRPVAVTAGFGRLEGVW